MYNSKPSLDFIGKAAGNKNNKTVKLQSNKPDFINIWLNHTCFLMLLLLYVALVPLLETYSPKQFLFSPVNLTFT